MRGYDITCNTYWVYIRTIKSVERAIRRLEKYVFVRRVGPVLVVRIESINNPSRWNTSRSRCTGEVIIYEQICAVEDEANLRVRHHGVATHVRNIVRYGFLRQ